MEITVIVLFIWYWPSSPSVNVWYNIHALMHSLFKN